MNDSIKYRLQVNVPHHNGNIMMYADGEGYWNTVDESSDLPYLKGQKQIMDRFWRHVRIIQVERVVYEEKIVD